MRADLFSKKVDQKLGFQAADILIKFISEVSFNLADNAVSLIRRQFNIARCIPLNRFISLNISL